jgi:predicted PurR-regulated permease PerM
MPLNSKIIPANSIRQVLFLALLIAMGLIIIGQLWTFLSAFLGAITLYVILLYPYKILVVKYEWRPWLASLVLMALSLIIMVLPLAYLTTVAIDRIQPLIRNPEILTSTFAKIHNYLTTQYGVNAFNEENVQKISGYVIPFTQKSLGSTLSAVGNIVLMYLVLYFLLVQTKEVETWLKNNVPLKSDNASKVLSKIRNLVYSNALGIPIVAIVQGTVGMLGYWIFDVKEFFLMGILTAISSVVPIIGTMLVYIPLAIFQFSTVGTLQGAGVGLWGFIVIGSIDNIARLLVQKQLADVHPLITLFGVFMGLGLFGFLGVIFGPLLLSIFFMLIQVYIDEFGKANVNENETN